MSKLLKIAAAAAAVFGLQAAQADILIDDFTVSQSLNVAGGLTGGNVAGNAGTCANILGCTRAIYIDNTNALQTSSAVTQFNNLTNDLGFGNELATNVSSGDRAIFKITYDGDNTANNFGKFGTGVSFAGYNALKFWVSSDGGQSGTQQVSITLKDMADKTAVATFTAFNTTGFGPDDYVLASFGFGGDFVAQAGFDWTQIGGVQAVVNVLGDTKSLDFALRAVTVPEPTSVALAGLALLGLGAIRRRKQ